MLDQELMDEISSNLPKDIPFIFISSINQHGLTALKDLIWKQLN